MSACENVLFLRAEHLSGSPRAKMRRAEQLQPQFQKSRGLAADEAIHTADGEQRSNFIAKLPREGRVKLITECILPVIADLN